MIKYIGIILLFNFTVHGQTKKEIKETLNNINSENKVESFKLNNPSWNIEIIELNENDSNFPKKLNKLEKGKSKRIKVNGEKFHYILLERTQEMEFRASYIYLNGGEFSKKKIDSLRPIIIEKYKSGILFEKLVENHNMDGNSKKGDLGWFKSGMMVSEFEKAVKEHKKGDIFLVNVDLRKWYYVVLKTYNDRRYNSLKLIKIKEQ